MTSNNPFPYSENRRSEYNSAGYWLHEQREFVKRNGSTAAGYQAHYAEAVASGQYTEAQVQAIYEADQDALAVAEQRFQFAQARRQRRTHQPTLL